MSVAWPQKTVKTSYVESRGNLPGNGHVGFVVPQHSVDDVRQLVGDCPLVCSGLRATTSCPNFRRCE